MSDNFPQTLEGAYDQFSAFQRLRGLVISDAKTQTLGNSPGRVAPHPTLLRNIGNQMGKIVKNGVPTATRLLGVAMAGIPIAVSTSLAINMPCAMTRKLTGVRSPADFSYGEHNEIEGEITDDDEVVIIDDLATKFDSKRIALLQLDAEAKRRGLTNVRCRHVVVFFDREQGAREEAEKVGITLHCVVPFLSKGLPILKRHMAAREYEVISEYLRDPAQFQTDDTRASLRDEALECKIGVSPVSG